MIASYDGRTEVNRPPVLPSLSLRSARQAAHDVLKPCRFGLAGKFEHVSELLEQGAGGCLAEPVAKCAGKDGPRRWRQQGLRRPIAATSTAFVRDLLQAPRRSLGDASDRIP